MHLMKFFKQTCPHILWAFLFSKETILLHLRTDVARDLSSTVHKYLLMLKYTINTKFLQSARHLAVVFMRVE